MFLHLPDMSHNFLPENNFGRAQAVRGEPFSEGRGRKTDPIYKNLCNREAPLADRLGCTACSATPREGR
jgi:hypothetical protein